jgi:alpha-tubulin suppressor-like RCC1 family protein
MGTPAAPLGIAQPVEVRIGEPVVEIALGHGTHACARTRDGRVYCWGGNDDGDTGVIDVIQDNKVEPAIVFPPALVPDLSDGSVDPAPVIAQIDAGGNHSCGIDDRDRLFCWGATSYGQLGVETPGPPMTVVEVALAR